MNWSLDDGERHLDLTVNGWADRWAPQMADHILLAVQTRQAGPMLDRIADLLTGCSFCAWARTNLNEGRFDIGTFCMASCPATPFCAGPLAGLNRCMAAWNRHRRGKALLGRGCEVCAAYPQCVGESDDRLEFCLRQGLRWCEGTYDDAETYLAEIRPRLTEAVA